MMARIPWLEVSSFVALFTVLAAFARARSATGAGLLVGAVAIGAPWLARALARRGRRPEAVRAAPSLVIAGAAIAASTLATGLAADPGFVRARALGVAVAVGALFALQARSAAEPGAWLAAAVTGVLAFAGTVNPRGSFASAPLALLALALVAAFAAFARTASPEERVRRAYERSGMLSSLGLLLLGATHPGPSWSVCALALSALALSLGIAAGHGLWAPEGASRASRAVLSILLGTAIATIASGLLDAVAVSFALGACGAFVLDRGLASSLARFPSARLARASREAVASLAGCESVEEVARAVLDPMRDPSDVRVTGELWLPETRRRATLDVVGTVRWSDLSLDSARPLLSWLRAHPAEAAYADAMRAVRRDRGDAAAVLSALHGRDAFCAVAGFSGETLSVVVLIPRGARIEPPAWDEREELLALGRRVASALESATALESARSRAARSELLAAEAESARLLAESALSVAEGRVARAPAIVRLTGSLETVWVGYSAPMRALDQRLRSVASSRGPLAIVCGAGGPREAVLWRLHGHGPWSGAPCAVIDGSRVHPRDALATLFGTAASGEGDARVDAQAGVLELAGEGTVALFDAQALGTEALSALAEALRARIVRRMGGGEPRPLTARVVLVLRDPPIESGLPAELCEALGDACVRVPSLAARSEDLEARVLLAIDRACRASCREPLGIAREALDALRAWPFPGDDRELDEVIERAVQCAKEKITREDLPAAIGSGASILHGGTSRTTSSADAESFESLERRILESALERAAGNKSEAARALGLARTTFLDKLRKHGLRE
jgi:DNA-binding NtrC family response regulator